MLRWALRYLIIATAVAAVFAMLQGVDWPWPEARQVSGERAQQRARDRQVDYDAGGQEENEYEASDDEAEPEVEDDGGYYDDDSSDDGSSEESDYDESNSGGLEQIIVAGPHGHFVVDAVVNGKPVEFMVDTGASHVVLTMEDAGRLGLSASNLDFTHRFESANGVVRAAPVELRDFRVGQLQLHDVEAFVNGGPLPISLLGMSFLDRLNGYEVARGRLVLRW